MPNVVDKLFDSVLSRLPKEEAESDYHRPDRADDALVVIDSPPENEGDVKTYQDHSMEPKEVSPLQDDEEEIIEGGIRSRGFEAIAFYKSKRFLNRKPFAGQWGIFYLRQGLAHVAWQISQCYRGYADPLVLARDFLRAHEHFHFQADIQTLMLESISGKNLYIPNRKRFRSTRSHFVEEAIANWQAHEWAKRTNVGIEEFSRDFMLCQPNAYSRFLEPIASLCGEWIANVVDGQPHHCTPRYDLGPWLINTPKEFMRKSLCPEYVIYPNALSDWIDPICITPPVKEITDSELVLKSLQNRHRALEEPWKRTKSKLIANKNLPGLNFKPWKPDGPQCYSVKVDEGNRAHLKNQGSGNWEAYEIGSHKELGHG